MMTTTLINILMIIVAVILFPLHCIVGVLFSLQRNIVFILLLFILNILLYTYLIKVFDKNFSKILKRICWIIYIIVFIINIFVGVIIFFSWSISH